MIGEEAPVYELPAQGEATHPNKIALVTDSTFDLSEDARLKYGMIVVPLHVFMGKTSYLDRIDLDSAGFYKLFRDAGQLAHSSQPGVGEFENVYTDLLESHDSVISVHISGRLSGTVQSAALAAERFDPNPGCEWWTPDRSRWAWVSWCRLLVKPYWPQGRWIMWWRLPRPLFASPASTGLFLPLMLP
jgi:hypothetical protein